MIVNVVLIIIIIQTSTHTHALAASCRKKNVPSWLSFPTLSPTLQNPSSSFLPQLLSLSFPPTPPASLPLFSNFNKDVFIIPRKVCVEIYDLETFVPHTKLLVHEFP